MRPAPCASNNFATAVLGAVTVALALIIPPWILAIPVGCLSLAVSVAVVRRPEQALPALRALVALLTATATAEAEDEAGGELEIQIRSR